MIMGGVLVVGVFVTLRRETEEWSPGSASVGSRYRPRGECPYSMSTVFGPNLESSDRHRGPTAAHGEDRSPSEAGHDIDDIQNEAERNSFLCRNAKGNKKEDKGALSDSQTGDADREDLEDEDGWIKREESGEAKPTET